MKIKSVSSILIFLIIALPGYALSNINTDDGYDGYIEQRNKAFSYLASHYNPDLQLIYESEDEGVHWLKKEKPYWKWGYNQTYWVYSDNLFAIKAVEPYSKEMAEAIAKKVKYYTDIYGKSNIFEIMLGGAGESIFRSESNIDISAGDNYAVLLRKHDGNSFLTPFENVDLLCYKALQFAFNGNYPGAVELLEEALGYWDGKGFYDLSTKLASGQEAVKGYYSNYKLATAIATARVLNYWDDRLNEIERKLWEYQNKNGGITTLTNIGSGMAEGSANNETTSLALMAYNYRYIHYMRGEVIKNIKKDYGYIYLSVISGLIFISLLYAALKKYKIRIKNKAI